MNVEMQYTQVEGIQLSDKSVKSLDLSKLKVLAPMVSGKVPPIASFFDSDHEYWFRSLLPKPTEKT